MVNDYNCFKCDDYNVTCPTYFTVNPDRNGVKENKCVYKAVAEHDLEKFRDGRTDLTLIDMLQKHLNVKIKPKELIKK